MMTSEVGTHDQRLGELLVAAAGDPRHLRREPLDVFLLLHQEACRNEEREVGVDVAGRLEATVQPLLDQLPDRVAVRPDRHAALDLGVVGELRPPHDIEIPAGKVLGLRRDLGHRRFLLPAPVLPSAISVTSSQSSVISQLSSRSASRDFDHPAFPVYIVALRGNRRGSARRGSLRAVGRARDQPRDGHEVRRAPAVRIERAAAANVRRRARATAASSVRDGSPKRCAARETTRLAATSGREHAEVTRLRACRSSCRMRAPVPRPARLALAGLLSAASTCAPPSSPSPPARRRPGPRAVNCWRDGSRRGRRCRRLRLPHTDPGPWCGRRDRSTRHP